MPVCSLLATRTQWCSVKTVPMVLDHETVVTGRYLTCFQGGYLDSSIDNLCFEDMERGVVDSEDDAAGIRGAFDSLFSSPDSRLTAHRARRHFVRLLAHRCQLLFSMRRCGA
jgi:hypothetical protein